MRGATQSRLDERPHRDARAGEMRGQMRRYGMRQPDTRIQDLSVRPTGRHPASRAHLRGVVVVLDARLNRFPVLERHLVPVSNQQRRGDDRFSDVRISACYEDPAEHETF